MLDVSGAQNLEVALVEGQDAGDSSSLGNSRNGRVHKIQTGIRTV